MAGQGSQRIRLFGAVSVGLSLAGLLGCGQILGVDDDLKDVRPLTCGWDLQMGKEDQQTTSSLAYGADGLVFVAGTFAQSVEFGDDATPLASGGGTDIFVSAVDSWRGTRWNRAITGLAEEVNPHIAVTSAGMTIVAGETTGGVDCGRGNLGDTGSKDVFLCAFEKDGTPSNDLQHLSKADDEQTLGGVVMDPANHIIFAGGFRTAMECLPGETIAPIGDGRDAYLCAFGLGGNIGVKKSFGGPGDQVIKAIAVDADGDIYVAGEFNADFSMGGFTETLRVDPASNGKPNVFVAKLAGSAMKQWGDAQWSNRFGEGLSREHHVSGITTSPDGSTYVVGNTTGTIEGKSAQGATDGFLLKLDVMGKPEWVHLFGAEENDYVTSVAVNTDGNVLIAGRFESAIQLPNGGAFMSPISNADTFIAAFSPQGDPLWHKQYPMATDEPPLLITKDPNTMALGGGFAAPINFGCGPRIPSGSDGFVVSIVP